jgi:Na+/H+-dicarboxylate symporter
MPTTVNIHMIGDSLCIPILAMMTLSAFNQPMPSFETYLLFAATFTWTKFSGAGLPGGTIFVMIPVLESILHFTPEMSALITLLYILIDPIATTGNVVGNNLFVIHFQKAYRRLVRL